MQNLRSIQKRAALRLLTATVCAAAAAGLLVVPPPRISIAPAATVLAQTTPGVPIDGTLGAVERCDDFFLDSAIPEVPFFALLLILFGDRDIPDPAWVLVQKGNPLLSKFRDANGTIVARSRVGDYPGNPLGDESVVNFEDYPDVHDSHDQNFYVRLDPDFDPNLAQRDLLSTFGIDGDGDRPGDPGYRPDTIEVEWETGILTSARTGDGRFFPRWAWPLPGDRVWTNGYWVFDCGHVVDNRATGAKGLHTEIHPPRAVASMREQVATPPAGGAPIPVTVADVYVHGRAGVIVDLLECGGRVILENRNCPTRTGETPRGSNSDDGNPDHDIALDHLGMPIDTNFYFTICSPPLPPGAVNPTLEIWNQPVLGYDTIGIAPQVAVQDASGPCAVQDDFGRPVYGPKQVRISLPLAGTGVTPDDTYARKIYVGWSGTPVPMRRFRVTLESMTFDEDHEDGAFDDCECAWFWTSIDRAPNKTIRLSDLSNAPERPMNDIGEGDTVTFTNALWEFLVPDTQPFTIRTFGYDGGVGEGSLDPKQDCYDDHFGHHDFASHVDLGLGNLPDACISSVALFDKSHPNDDPFDVLWRPILPSEIASLFGAWPATGSRQLTLASPLRCQVTYQGPAGVTSDKVYCRSADEARADFEAQGFQVFAVREYHEYRMVVTIESLPADSDGDGLNDGDEISTYGTNPLNPDSDGDGLTDGAEVNTYGTDPLDGDSDDDGLSDGAEVNTYNTNPLDPDTDDDELPDGVEVSTGMDPLDADTDNDGLPDGEDPQFVRNAVSALPEGVFRATGNKTSILSLLDAIESRIKAGEIEQALRELAQLRTRLDGCPPAAGADDWVVDCATQTRVRSLVDLLIAALGT